MNSQFILESEHLFYYSAAQPVSAAMLAESLIGLDGVVNQSTKALGRFFKVRIYSEDVLIQKIEFGSYKDSFIVRLVFGKEAELEKRIDKFRAKLGLNKMSTKTVITLIIAAAIGYAVYHYATASKDEKALISINNSFNNWGKEVGMTGPEFLAKLGEIIKNKEDLKRQVVRLTRPKGSSDNGSITLDNDSNFTISADAVAAVPANYSVTLPDVPIKDFTKAMIVIRAADLDRLTGWYGIALEIYDHRVSVQLEESVDRSKIILGKFNEVDITVIYDLKKNGDRIPKQYIIRKLYDPVVKTP